jgi:hypothetical protein
MAGPVSNSNAYGRQPTGQPDGSLLTDDEAGFAVVAPVFTPDGSGNITAAAISNTECSGDAGADRVRWRAECFDGADERRGRGPGGGVAPMTAPLSAQEAVDLAFGAMDLVGTLCASLIARDLVEPDFMQADCQRLAALWRAKGNGSRAFAAENFLARLKNMEREKRAVAAQLMDAAAMSQRRN